MSVFTPVTVANEAEPFVDGGRLQQRCVLARQADGERPVHVDGRHDLAIDLANEHHAHDVERFCVGNAQPVDKRRLLANAREHLADLGAAAVHDDWTHTNRLHEDDVGRELRQAVFLVGRARERVAAVLHDHRFAKEAADIRQRVSQDLRLLRWRCHQLVPMFSST